MLEAARDFSPRRADLWPDVHVEHLEVHDRGDTWIEVTEGKFAIKFSTIAIFFILIDIELLFIWPWAMLYRRLGWFGFAEMLVFLAILMLGFLYIWKKGGLEWE